MIEKSYSVNITEQDLNPLKITIQREQMNYNYGPLTVKSNNVTYPFTIIVIPSIKEVRKKKLISAAEALLKDYEEDDELTIFTSIDADDFHA